MKAHEVIRPNSDSGFWDVPGTDKMVHRYRECGRLVYEVIVPSQFMGPHDKVMCLSDGQTKKCYGTVSTSRTLYDPSYSDYDRVCRVSDVMDKCYRIISDVIGWDVLSDCRFLQHHMGCFLLWDYRGG